MDESNGRVFDGLEFITKLEFSAKLLDVERGVNNWNGVFLEQNLTAELVEDLGDSEEVHVNCVGEVDQQVRTLFNPTRHVQTSGSHNFRVATLCE